MNLHLCQHYSLIRLVKNLIMYAGCKYVHISVTIFSNITAGLMFNEGEQ